MSNSPSAGVSLRRIEAGFPGAGIPVIRVHYSADPSLTLEKIAELRARYTSEARWRREMEIEYEALEGERLYPEYSPEHNVCQPFDVSDRERWRIWQGADPHGRTPHAFVWVAFGDDGDVRVCGELWPEKQYLTREYVEMLEWLESDATDKPLAWEWAQGKKLHVARRVMDTHGHAVNSDEGVDYFETYRQRGLAFQEANKSELGAVRDRIGELLVPGRVIVGDQERREARLKVFRTCVETLREFEDVRFPAGEVKRPSQEQPETYRKHCLDCIQYVFAGQPRFVPPRRTGGRWQPIYPATGY